MLLNADAAQILELAHRPGESTRLVTTRTAQAHKIVRIETKTGYRFLVQIYQPNKRLAAVIKLDANNNVVKRYKKLRAISPRLEVGGQFTHGGRRSAVILKIYCIHW